MCGIYGQLALKGSSPSAWDDISLDLLRHRGPDERGSWRGDGIFLDPTTSGNSVVGNTANRNGDDGIDTDAPDTVLTRNIASENFDFGICHPEKLGRVQRDSSEYLRMTEGVPQNGRAGESWKRSSENEILSEC